METHQETAIIVTEITYHDGNDHDMDVCSMDTTTRGYDSIESLRGIVVRMHASTVKRVFVNGTTRQGYPVMVTTQALPRLGGEMLFTTHV